MKADRQADESTLTDLQSKTGTFTEYCGNHCYYYYYCIYIIIIIAYYKLAVWNSILNEYIIYELL
jgi:hypothetical protein